MDALLTTNVAAEQVTSVPARSVGCRLAAGLTGRGLFGAGNDGPQLPVAAAP